MKRLLAGLTLCTAIGALSGCYYDPGYSYVRSNAYAGDVYYGAATTVYSDGDYYGGAYPSYWYPGYDCCYGGGINVWYGRGYYRGRPGYWGHGYGGRGGYVGHGGNWHGGGGHWSGGHGGGWHGR